MTIDRADLFRLAWAWARRDAEFHWVYDWTPGACYGTRRATTAAERRAVFARHLREAWAEMKARAARLAAAQRTARPAAEVQGEIVMLECKDRLGVADWLRLDALRAELTAAVAMAA